MSAVTKLRAMLIRLLAGRWSVTVNVDIYGHYHTKGPCLLHHNCIDFPALKLLPDGSPPISFGRFERYTGYERFDGESARIFRKDSEAR